MLFDDGGPRRFVLQNNPSLNPHAATAARGGRNHRASNDNNATINLDQLLNMEQVDDSSTDTNSTTAGNGGGNEDNMGSEREDGPLDWNMDGAGGSSGRGSNGSAGTGATNGGPALADLYRQLLASSSNSTSTSIPSTSTSSTTTSSNLFGHNTKSPSSSSSNPMLSATDDSFPSLFAPSSSSSASSSTLGPPPPPSEPTFDWSSLFPQSNFGGNNNNVTNNNPFGNIFNSDPGMINSTTGISPAALTSSSFHQPLSSQEDDDLALNLIQSLSRANNGDNINNNQATLQNAISRFPGGLPALMTILGNINNQQGGTESSSSFNDGSAASAFSPMGGVFSPVGGGMTDDSASSVTGGVDPRLLERPAASVAAVPATVSEDREIEETVPPPAASTRASAQAQAPASGKKPPAKKTKTSATTNGPSAAARKVAATKKGVASGVTGNTTAGTGGGAPAKKTAGAGTKSNGTGKKSNGAKNGAAPQPPSENIPIFDSMMIDNEDQKDFIMQDFNNSDEFGRSGSFGDFQSDGGSEDGGDDDDDLSLVSAPTGFGSGKNKRPGKTSVSKLATSELHSTTSNSKLAPVPDWIDKPPPDVYKNMSSKEKRQLRNKISARNFRHRRKEYIGTLEDAVKSRDGLISSLRQQLSEIKLENTELKAENKELKSKWEDMVNRISTETPASGSGASPSVTKAGMGVGVGSSSANNGVKSPDTIAAALKSPPQRVLSPEVSAAAMRRSDSGAIPKPNMNKDVGANGRRWGQGMGTGGGFLPVHTTFVPEFRLDGNSSGSESSNKGPLSSSSSPPGLTSGGSSSSSASSPGSMAGVSPPPSYNSLLSGNQTANMNPNLNLSSHQSSLLPFFTSHLRSTASVHGTPPQIDSSSSNSSSGSGNSNAIAGKGTFDDFFSSNPYWLRPDNVEEYRSQLYSKLANNLAAHAVANKNKDGSNQNPNSNQQQQQPQHPRNNNIANNPPASPNGAIALQHPNALPSGWRFAFFSSPNLITAGPSNDNSSTKDPRDTSPPPSYSAANSPSAINRPSPLLASQQTTTNASSKDQVGGGVSLLSKMAEAFWLSFAGASGGNGNGNGGAFRHDSPFGKASNRFTEVKSPSPSPVSSPVDLKQQPQSVPSVPDSPRPPSYKSTAPSPNLPHLNLASSDSTVSAPLMSSSSSTSSSSSNSNNGNNSHASLDQLGQKLQGLRLAAGQGTPPTNEKEFPWRKGASGEGVVVGSSGGRRTSE